MPTSIDRRILRRARHELCQAWRSTLVAKGAIEVTTPILNSYPDIAPVRQFRTSHPTTGTSACLRIAPTEHLKRLLADGESRVFEFAQNFRDDPRDATHLPEFMSLEYMAADDSCSSMEELAIELLLSAVTALEPVVPSAAPWALGFRATQVQRVSISNLLTAPDDQRSVEQLDQLVGDHAAALGGVVLMGDFPESLGGPAVGHGELPGFKQRTEMFVNGLEVANMSSTLTDPTLLKAWHHAGLKLKDALGIQPNEQDIALIAAAERGIPNSAVIGVGIERVLQAYFGLENISQEFYNGY